MAGLCGHRRSSAVAPATAGKGSARQGLAFIHALETWRIASYADPQWAVARLKDEQAVNRVGSGRLCTFGLTTDNVDTVARAMAAVME